MSNPTCSVEGCEKPSKTRGWCGMHYKRWKKHGDPLQEPWRGCSVDGCDERHQSHRYCRSHLYRWKRYGDPLAQGERAPRKPKPPCSHDGCGITAHVKGLCPAHFQRMSRYGVTPEQYDAALERGCPICHRKVDRLVIDHDHACCPGGKSCGECVRDLICRACNAMLGLAGDEPDRLRSAADYLDRSRRATP